MRTPSQTVGPFFAFGLCDRPQNELVPHELYVSYTPRPVFGSASAATSATVRCAQPASCCHAGFGS